MEHYSMKVAECLSGKHVKFGKYNEKFFYESC